MGLFKKKKQEEPTSTAPEISDLPPIPDASSADLSSSTPDLSADLSDIPDLPSQDTSSADMDFSNEDPFASQDDSFSTDAPVGSVPIEDISSDHPLPDLSPSDIDPSLNEKKELPSAATPSEAPAIDLPSQDEPVVLSENPSSTVGVNSQPSDETPVEDSPVQTAEELTEQPVAPVVEEKEKPENSQPSSSLPVFNEVSTSDQVDIESLTISELFIKREQYAKVLDTLHTTKKELDALVKKSATAKPNEKIGTLLKKAATKHAELNKNLLFVEEHLVE